MPIDTYDDLNHSWGAYLYNNMNGDELINLGIDKGRFSSGGQSFLPHPTINWHQTLITDFFNKDAFNVTQLRRLYFPHTAIKLNLYLHCNNNYVNPGDVIYKQSYVHDNTRGRMRWYPFRPDNCSNNPSPEYYDVIFRPTGVNRPFPNTMYFDDPSNLDWTDGLLGTLNYYESSDVNLSGCSSLTNPYGINDIYYDHDQTTGSSFYGFYPFPGPFSIHTNHLYNYTGKTLAGYENVSDLNLPLNFDIGLEHNYKIKNSFDLSIINPSEKIIYNPTEVTLEPTPGLNYFNINFPAYYTFKTITGSIPTVQQVNDANIGDNGGPFFPLRLVPTRTDVRSENNTDPNDVNNPRHSVFASKYILNSGSQITVEQCVALYDLSFVVNSGATLVFDDFPQLRGKEDKSNYPTGRFKIIEKGGAILRNYDEIQYVQNGIITQSYPLHYIAKNSIISGAAVSLDMDQDIGNYDIHLGADVVFEAGDFIHLTNGFNVMGGNFQAIIDPSLLQISYDQCIWNQRMMINNENNSHTFNGKKTIPLQIIPNPGLNEIELVDVLTSADQITISIFDMQGNIVLNSVNSKKSKINIEILSAGLYGLRIVETNQFAKFVKL